MFGRPAARYKAAEPMTHDRLVPLIAAEMDGWQTGDPRAPDVSDRTLGPLMVHKAQTALDVVAAVRMTNVKRNCE